MLHRDVAPRDRAFQDWMEKTQRRLDALHRRPSAQVNEQGEIRLGDAVLRFDTQPDNTIEVTMRNGITDGPPKLLGVLE